MSLGARISTSPDLHDRPEQAIEDVINGKWDFFVLNKGQAFMQYAGAHVEHRLNSSEFKRTKRENLSKREVLELFTHFMDSPETLHPDYEFEDVIF